MNTREQFGSYILLKKLGEDALGETFRAGRFGSQGIEQVVLLRVFNGRGLDGRELWKHVASRGELQGLLRSPNLGSGIDFGELEGVPYVAYDYISGKSLAALMAQANRQLTPLPIDHALLISERLGLGLTAALETRVGDGRVLHGLVVPDLVMISNEGEAKLLGFEVAAGLRAMVAGTAAVRGFERYLSPETLEGAPLHKTDDVYSLGAILFEMLTGNPLPPQPASVARLVEEATHDGEPLPESIARLLQRSLAPRDQRIGDCASWHKALSQMMIEGQYNPTTFNLAFYMHSLFRDEIEKETRELQVEKKIEPPTSTAEMASVSAASHRDSGADTVMVSSSDIAPEQASGGGSRKGLMAGLAAVAVLVLGGVGWYFFGTPKTAPPEPVVETAPAEPEAVPAGPTQEEIQAELERMRAEMAESLTAQSEEMQEQLAKQYEARLKELQQQYEATKKALEQQPEPAPPPPAPAEPIQSAEIKTPDPATTEPAPKDAAPGENTAKTVQGPQTQPASPPPPAVAQALPQKPAAKPAPPPAQTATATPKAPAEPPVRRGDLVEPGPGVVPPRLIEQAAARYPEAARRFKREASITVRVLVDENGRVVETEQVTKKVGLGLDEAAVAASRRSTFQPATKGGVPVKMWHVLRFDFRP